MTRLYDWRIHKYCGSKELSVRNILVDDLLSFIDSVKAEAMESSASSIEVCIDEDGFMTLEWFVDKSQSELDAELAFNRYSKAMDRDNREAAFVKLYSEFAEEFGLPKEPTKLHTVQSEKKET